MRRLNEGGPSVTLVLTTRGVPVTVSSLRKFVKGGGRRRFRVGVEAAGHDGAGSTLSNWRGGSNGPLPKPGVSHARALESAWLAPPTDVPMAAPYDPTLLDDPELITGRHRTVMNLPCFRASIIPYVKGGVLKAELNDQFRAQHPTLPQSLTLSKIRRLKRVLLELCLDEVSNKQTLHTYFSLFILHTHMLCPYVKHNYFSFFFLC